MYVYVGLRECQWRPGQKWRMMPLTKQRNFKISNFENAAIINF